MTIQLKRLLNKKNYKYFLKLNKIEKNIYKLGFIDAMIIIKKQYEKENKPK